MKMRQNTLVAPELVNIMSICVVLLGLFGQGRSASAQGSAPGETAVVSEDSLKWVIGEASRAGISLSKEQAREALGYSIQADRGHFLISGEIVDSHGKPLDGVQMKIRWVYPDIPREHVRNGIKTVDGRFNLSVKDAESVRIEFEKVGFRSCETNFAIVDMSDQGIREIARAIVKGETPKVRAQIVKAENLRLVMKIEGKTERLPIKQSTDKPESARPAPKDIPMIEAESVEKLELTGEQERKAEALMGQVLEKRFILSGEVVNSEGARLPRVALTACCGRSHPQRGDLIEEDRDVACRDGVFALDIKGAATIELKATKPGYCPVITNFVPERPSEELQTRIARAVLEAKPLQPEQPVVRIDNLRLVLKKSDEPIPLVTCGGTLEYETGGKGSVFNFDQPRDLRSGEPLGEVENVHGTNQLPARCTYLAADCEADGRLKLVPRREGLVGEVWPKRLTITMSDKDSGFVLGNVGTREEMSGKMKEAPEQGYRQTLVLDADLVERLVSAARKKQFQLLYFKAQDQYGKGMLIPSGIISYDSSSVEMGIEFHLQLDGSRNLDQP